MIRVLLVDDHPVVREGVATVLTQEPDVRIVGQAGSAEQMLQDVGQLCPDVLVIDVRLPEMDGIEACEVLRVSNPRIKTVVLTRFPNESMMLRAFSAGAKGFLVKESDPEIVRQAIRIVAEGGTFVDPKVARKLVILATKGRRAKGPFGLTLQEMRVVELLPKGLSNREIGSELCISQETVKTHLRHAMRKMQAADRAEAAAIAIREGLA